MLQMPRIRTHLSRLHRLRRQDFESLITQRRNGPLFYNFPWTLEQANLELKIGASLLQWARLVFWYFLSIALGRVSVQRFSFLYFPLLCLRIISSTVDYPFCSTLKTETYLNTGPSLSFPGPVVFTIWISFVFVAAVSCWKFRKSSLTWNIYIFRSVIACDNIEWYDWR